MDPQVHQGEVGPGLRGPLDRGLPRCEEPLSTTREDPFWLGVGLGGHDLFDEAAERFDPEESSQRPTILPGWTSQAASRPVRPPPRLRRKIHECAAMA